MPATSQKQKRLMDAAAHNKSFAKKVGIPQKVAKEFSKESKGMKFSKGGDMKESKAMVKKELEFMKKKGAPKSMIEHEKKEAKMARGGGIEHKGKTKGKMVKMAMGGSVGSASKRADGIASKGKTKCKVM